MKRLLFALPVLLLAAAVFFVYSISHLRPDLYRVQVQQYLKENFQQDVELGTLSIQWKGIHPTFMADGFTVKNSATHQVLFQAKKARAAVRLSGILLGQFVIDRLILEETHFSFLRQENGDWNWDFSGRKKSKFSVLSLAGWKIRIESFEAPDASLYYADQSQLPYFHQEWKGLKILLYQLSEGACKVRITPLHQGLVKKLELSLISPQQLFLRGDFGPYGTGEGDVQNPFQDAHFRLKLTLQGVDLKVSPVEGKATLDIEAFGEGFHPDSLKRTLIVKGETVIKEGRLFSRHLAGELLKTISPMPGFSGLTRQAFKGDFAAFSQSGGTPFQNLKADFRLSNGSLFTENLEIDSLYYRVKADGILHLIENRLELKGDCFFTGAFAEHLISRARDMEVLANVQKELQVPFFYKGPASELKPSADLFYIANRLIQFRGEQLASRGVQKINEFLEANRK